MGIDRPAASIDRQSSFGERLSTDFDAWLLRNMVWSFIEADDQLAYLCDGRSIVSSAAGLRKRQQGDDVAYLGKIEAIEATLDWLARQRALELVAQACAACLEDSEQWASNTKFDDKYVEEAQVEARQWLREHTNEAARVGALGALE